MARDGAGLLPTLNCLSEWTWNVGLENTKSLAGYRYSGPNTLIWSNDELVCC
jgi:hypothetical protein